MLSDCIIFRHFRGLSEIPVEHHCRRGGTIRGRVEAKDDLNHQVSLEPSLAFVLLESIGFLSIHDFPFENSPISGIPVPV